MTDDTDIQITKTVTIHIHREHSRNSAVQPVTVNGQLTNIPVGVDHPVSPEVADALKDSGIAHTIVSDTTSQPAGDAGAASGVESGASPEAAAPEPVAVAEPVAEEGPPVPAAEQQAQPEETPTPEAAVGDDGSNEPAPVVQEVSQPESVAQPELPAEEATRNESDELPVEPEGASEIVPAAEGEQTDETVTSAGGESAE